MQTAPNIVHGDWKTYQHEAERVRAMVFIAEQKVPRELEFDEDDKTAEHFISFDARHMVTGCARLLDNGRIGRVAVLRPFRGRGIGEAVMKTVLERAKARGMKDVHLAAQVQAMPFYERLGLRVRRGRNPAPHDAPRFLRGEESFLRVMQLLLLGSSRGVLPVRRGAVSHA